MGGVDKPNPEKQPQGEIPGMDSSRPKNNPPDDQNISDTSSDQLNPMELLDKVVASYPVDDLYYFIEHGLKLSPELSEDEQNKLFLDYLKDTNNKFDDAYKLFTNIARTPLTLNHRKLSDEFIARLACDCDLRLGIKKPKLNEHDNVREISKYILKQFNPHIQVFQKEKEISSLERAEYEFSPLLMRVIKAKLKEEIKESRDRFELILQKVNRGFEKLEKEKDMKRRRAVIIGSAILLPLACTGIIGFMTSTDQGDNNNKIIGNQGSNKKEQLISDSNFHIKQTRLKDIPQGVNFTDAILIRDKLIPCMVNTAVEDDLIDRGNKEIIYSIAYMGEQYKNESNIHTVPITNEKNSIIITIPNTVIQQLKRICDQNRNTSNDEIQGNIRKIVKFDVRQSSK